jgi:hypothetical protein
LDKKVLLNADYEDESKNIIDISSAGLKNKTLFILSYHEAMHQKGLERIFTINGENDGQLKKQKGQSTYTKNF